MGRAGLLPAQPAAAIGLPASRASRAGSCLRCRGQRAPLTGIMRRELAPNADVVLGGERDLRRRTGRENLEGQERCSALRQHSKNSDFASRRGVSSPERGKAPARRGGLSAVRDVAGGRGSFLCLRKGNINAIFRRAFVPTLGGTLLRNTSPATIQEAIPTPQVSGATELDTGCTARWAP